MRILDERARTATGRSFAQLSHGYTHYEAAGPRQARPVILVHGFSVPCFVWDPIFRLLADAGMRVVRYDLYGRGYSDRPRLGYAMPLFVDQLRGLLDFLECEQADLVGLSMGGPISATFAAIYPERVRKLVLIDPSGIREFKLGLAHRIVTAPFIGELLFGIAGARVLLHKIAADVFEPTLIEAFRERYEEQMRFQGFVPALLSTVRHRMLGSFRSAYSSVGRMGISVLLIWGTKDTTVPFEQSRELLEMMPHAQFAPIENCGHLPHYEQPETVHRHIMDFLN